MLKNKIDLREIFGELKRSHTAVTSVCTINEFVLDSVMKFQREKENPIVIESTANQVNHQGGYSGFRPFEFRNMVFSFVKKYGIETDKLILGVDHAGPWPWLKLKSSEAMEEAKKLVSECVKAGYKKIHIDASYKFPDDVSWSQTLIAKRQAELCWVAEQAYKSISNEDPVPPVYVLGTDVPTPGGSRYDEQQRVVSAEFIVEDLEVTRREFLRLGLQDAWNRVIGYVVNSGADFSGYKVVPYESLESDRLKSFLCTIPYALEAHSTDYQKLENLISMVRDGFVILKVGPELTFRFREAIFALCDIEHETVKPEYRSSLKETIISEMKADRKYWENYYHEDTELKYSLYDRIRYYWANKKVKKALERLLTNLQGLHVPNSLIHQYYPDVIEEVSGFTVFDPVEFIHRKIELSLMKYWLACRSSYDEGMMKKSSQLSVNL